jgi:WD40 repeat protein
VSGSEDCTLKLWLMSDVLDPSVTKEMHAAVTEKAHDKTICSVVVAPNDKFIASGSMDKTAKVNMFLCLKMRCCIAKRGILFLSSLFDSLQII